MLSLPTGLFAILGCCKTVHSAKQLLDRMGISEEDMEDASLYYAAEGDTQVLHIDERKNIFSFRAFVVRVVLNLSRCFSGYTVDI